MAGGAERERGRRCRDAENGWGGRSGQNGRMAGVARCRKGSVDKTAPCWRWDPTRKSEAESDEAGANIRKFRNSLRLFARSTNGLYWRNQRNPIAAEIAGSGKGKLTGKILAGVKWRGMVTSYKRSIRQIGRMEVGKQSHEEMEIGNGDGDRKWKWGSEMGMGVENRNGDGTEKI